jgi:hypothetical protein
MKLLYAARVCRYDLLQAIGRLASFITRWDAHCDKMLHRLMCYVQGSLHLRCVGWVGDAPSEVGIHLYADADFAECKRTGRSTSGVFFCVAGPDTFFPLQGASRKQSAVSHSTPEAEIVAADHGLRTVGIPAMDLWDVLLQRDVVLVVHDDNSAMIQVCRTGKNPTMRHLGRIHRVSAQWLHERFKDPCYHLVYEETNSMRADVFTKRLRRSGQVEPCSVPHQPCRCPIVLAV